MKNFKKNAILSLVLGASLALSACGKKGGDSTDPTAKGSSSAVLKTFATCDRRGVATYNVCIENIGAVYNDPGYISAVQSSCTSTGGYFSTVACDRSGSIGSCVLAGGQENEVHTTYFASQYDLTSARSACEAGGLGVFTPAN